MQKVKIYNVNCWKAYMMSEQGRHFSLSPWGKNTPYFEGEDDGGADYFLPDGFTIGKMQDNSPAIYDKNNKFCELITIKNTPAIIADSVNPIFLKRI